MVEWEDGQLVQVPYVEINGTRYPVVMPEYSGNTPMTAENLNKMQNDLSDKINEEVNNLDIKIGKLKANKILWQNAYVMNENQIANLSEKVSEQNTGIVLVFSAYSDGEAHDYGWYEYFIPKKIVELYAGAGHDILIPDNSQVYGIRAAKYLYVSDTQIRGNANNAGTHGNINNSSVVLRYVLGV